MVSPKSLKGWKLMGRGGIASSEQLVGVTGCFSVVRERGEDEHTMILKIKSSSGSEVEGTDDSSRCFGVDGCGCGGRARHRLNMEWQLGIHGIHLKVVPAPSQ